MHGMLAGYSNGSVSLRIDGAIGLLLRGKGRQLQAYNCLECVAAAMDLQNGELRWLRWPPPCIVN